MKASDVVGKKIVRVEQTRWYNDNLRRFEYEVTLVLDDGTRIVASASETLDCPAATMYAIRPAANKVNG